MSMPNMCRQTMLCALSFGEGGGGGGEFQELVEGVLHPDLCHTHHDNMFLHHSLNFLQHNAKHGCLLSHTLGQRHLVRAGPPETSLAFIPRFLHIAETGDPNNLNGG